MQLVENKKQYRGRKIFLALIDYSKVYPNKSKRDNNHLSYSTQSKNIWDRQISSMALGQTAACEHHEI